MAFNLKGIREAMFNQADWAPKQSGVAVTRANEFINRAYNQIAQDAPFLFFEDEVRWPIHEDQFPTLATDLLTVASLGDAWILETELAVGTTGALVWEADRSWAGRALMLTVPGTSPAQTEMIRIREVWTVGTKIRISLETPWRNTTDTGITYRVINDEYTFPDDLIELKNANLFEDSNTYPRPLTVSGQARAEWVAYPHNADFQTSGPPRILYRREYQTLKAPTHTPVLTEVAGAWAGPEPTGAFDYLITYVWGSQEIWSHAPGPETQTSLSPQAERYEPYWESSPSDVSNELTNTTTLRLSLPNIDFTLGFGDAGTTRYGRSGIRKRIYRRRKGTTDLSIEFPNTFFLLDEVDGLVTSYDDDGSVTPDYRRPFREVHGYQTFRLYPRPSRRYQLVLRMIRRPMKLTDDSDSPVLTADGAECLILRSLAYLYDSQGNAAMSDRTESKYEKALFSLKKRYGDLRPASVPRQRAVARNHRRFIRDRDLAGIVDDAT